MTKNLEQLFELIINEMCVGSSVNSVERYFDAFYRVFIKQIAIKGKLHIPTFGTFYLEQKEDKVMKVGDPHNGGSKFIHVKPKYYVTFKQSSFMDRIMNDNDFVYSKKCGRPKTINKLKKKKKDLSDGEILTMMLNKAYERNEDNKKWQNKE